MNFFSFSSEIKARVPFPKMHCSYFVVVSWYKFFFHTQLDFELWFEFHPHTHAISPMPEVQLNSERRILFQERWWCFKIVVYTIWRIFTNALDVPIYETCKNRKQYLEKLAYRRILQQTIYKSGYVKTSSSLHVYTHKTIILQEPICFPLTSISVSSPIEMRSGAISQTLRTMLLSWHMYYLVPESMTQLAAVSNKEDATVTRRRTFSFSEDSSYASADFVLLIRPICPGFEREYVFPHLVLMWFFFSVRRWNSLSISTIARVQLVQSLFHHLMQLLYLKFSFSHETTSPKI